MNTLGKWESQLCVDAGGPHCPCYLAEVGRCINCGLLSVVQECVCEWTGSCIYSELFWNGNLSKGPRSTYLASDVERTQIGGGAFVLSLELPEHLATELTAPGSYVFLRPATYPEHFYTPISVMKVKGCKVDFAIQVEGPKTVALNREKGAISVRGPFGSGIIGLENLKMPAKNALVIGKGIAQGAAMHTAGYLIGRNVDTTVALGPGPVGRIFGPDWANEIVANRLILDKKADHNREDLSDVLRLCHFDLVVSSGPDVQHKMVYGLVKRLSAATRLAFTNNSMMCCGEGICGACKSVIDDPNARACKALPRIDDLVFLR